MKFEDLNLNKPLFKALDDLGLYTPTLIQEKSFSVIMSGKDMLGIAQTGTGKTLAYLLPTLRLWQFAKNPFPQVLIIVPTRELVMQVCEEIERLTPYMNLVTVGVYGGANIKTQAAKIVEGVDFVVGTPGRVMDLMLHGDLIPKNIKRLIIDEVDETLNMGDGHQLKTILDLLPRKKQTLLFSATMNEDIEEMIDNHFIAPVYVEAAPAGTPVNMIQQYMYTVPNYTTKINLIRHLLEDEQLKKVLIFTESKKYADALYEVLAKKYDDQVEVIHSNKAQNFRFNAVTKFKNNELRILVATDLVSRGMDINEVTHVINMNIPIKTENYIHRIGRTGRQGMTGIAITLFSPFEEEQLKAVESYMQTTIEKRPIPEEVEISDLLTVDEQPEVRMRNQLGKFHRRENVGPSFHEKSLKNQKVNKVNLKPRDKKRIKRKKR